MCAERELLLTQTTLTISTFKGWWGVMSKDLQGTPELGARGRDKGCEPLTKEALDADLDAWRMKDKKFGGDSLDADMDKEEEPSKQDGDEILGTTPAVEGDDTSKIGASNSVKVITMKSTRARTIDGNSNVDKEHVSATRKEGPTKGVDVKL
jgi:hypothetical protein